MSTLIWSTISKSMKDVLVSFMKSELGSHFYLAGGTALSLQIGHRIHLNDADWQSVKAFFIEQAKIIEQSWLQ